MKWMGYGVSAFLPPWGDMEAEMRKEGVAPYALESGDPIAEFDIIGFSLAMRWHIPMCSNMLDLAGLPFAE